MEITKDGLCDVRTEPLSFSFTANPLKLTHVQRRPKISTDIQWMPGLGNREEKAFGARRQSRPVRRSTVQKRLFGQMK